MVAYGAFTIVARADAAKMSCDRRNSQSVLHIFAKKYDGA